MSDTDQRDPLYWLERMRREVVADLHALNEADDLMMSRFVHNTLQNRWDPRNKMIETVMTAIAIYQAQARVKLVEIEQSMEEMKKKS